MPAKKAIVSVTNDLTTDQRVDRTCQALVKAGYDVTLVGRKLRSSLPLKSRSYLTHRMKLWFNKGPLFYANYNLRLFFFLLFHRTDLIVSNDLDTLLGCYLAYKTKNFLPFSSRKGGGSTPPPSPLPRKGRGSILHDCHEYFRGMPELTGRKGTLRIWKWIEDRIFPRLKHVVAVNDSVAGLYQEEYGNKITVIRNVPIRRKDVRPKSREELGIKSGQKIIIYQGAVNIDRGLEEVVRAMKYLRSDAKLVIAGIGDIFRDLQQLILDEKVPGKVILTGQIPFQELTSYTLMADIGLSIEKDVSLNYHFSLPNKFLDYIQANVPVLISNFPEMKAILDKYFIGEVLENHDPKYIAEKIDAMLMNEGRMEVFRENL